MIKSDKSDIFNEHTVIKEIKGFKKSVTPFLTSPFLCIDDLVQGFRMSQMRSVCCGWRGDLKRWWFGGPITSVPNKTEFPDKSSINYVRPFSDHRAYIKPLHVTVLGGIEDG